jgi:plastocyanin
MHRSRPLVVLFLVALLAACSGAASSAPASDDGDGAASGGGGGETVSMAGFAFSPSDLTIQAGTTVTFTDTGGHTVTEGIDGEAADDPIVDEDGGSDIDVTFDEPGTYNITCKLHPDMNMTITVEG